jgi:hypothetical protein
VSAALDAGRRQQAFRIEQQIVAVNRDAGRGFTLTSRSSSSPKKSRTRFDRKPAAFIDVGCTRIFPSGVALIAARR